MARLDLAQQSSEVQLQEILSFCQWRTYTTRPVNDAGPSRPHLPISIRTVIMDAERHASMTESKSMTQFWISKLLSVCHQQLRA